VEAILDECKDTHEKLIKSWEKFAIRGLKDVCGPKLSPRIHSLLKTIDKTIDELKNSLRSLQKLHNRTTRFKEMVSYRSERQPSSC